MRRNIIHSLLIAAILSGCQSENPFPNEQEGEGMLINVKLQTPQVIETRVVGAGADMNFDAYGFTLVGYHTEGEFGGDSENTYPNLFDYQTSAKSVIQVTKGADGKYITPFSKRALSETTYLSFFAWGQNKTADTTSGIVAAIGTSADKGYPWLDVKVDADPSKQVDVVGARQINRSNNWVITALDLDFYHLLTKMTFKAKNISETTIKLTSATVKYATNKVYQKARFTFATSGYTGSYDLTQNTAYYTTASTLNISLNIGTNASTSLGQILLLPQNLEKGAIGIELKYKVTLAGGVESEEITRTVVLSPLKAQMGNNYVYTLNINADEITLTDPQIGNWLEGMTSLPLIAGDKKSLLYLDGNDAPYTDTDGTRYWLDRSGYNRHCTLDKEVVYDKTNKQYEFNNRLASVPAYILSAERKGYMGYCARMVSSFPVNLSNVTMECIASSTSKNDDLNNTYQNMLLFTKTDVTGIPNGVDDRTLSVHLPSNSNDVLSLVFDVVNYKNNRVETTITNPTLFDECNYYVFVNNATSSYRRTFINGSLVGNVNSSSAVYQPNGIKYGYIGGNFIGKIKYMKIADKALPDAEIIQNYGDRKNLYGISGTKPQLVVKDGLKLWLEGPLSGGQWLDISGNGNHAAIRTFSVTWNSDKKAIELRGGYLKLLKSLGNPQSFTLDIVVKEPNFESNSNTVICFANGNTSENNRQCHVHLPWYNTDVITFNTAGTDVCNLKILNAKKNYIHETNVAHFTFVRNMSKTGDNMLAIYKNGVKIANDLDYGITANSNINEMTDCYIGAQYVDGRAYQLYKGYIMSVRFYNKALTDSEIMQNHDSDKKNWTIP